MTPKPRILVTGSTGLLGPYLLKAADQVGLVLGVARQGADINVDLTDKNATREAHKLNQSDIIIHAAGFTDVDACERDPDSAFKVNKESVSNLIEFLSPGTFFVYISTDQVYPDTTGLHIEGTENPINIYGRFREIDDQED